MTAHDPAPFLIGGDWNAHPADRHRHRPAWIADQADLTIIHAGSGPFGNIDYALTDAFGARSLGRGGKHGSDHGFVGWTTINVAGHHVRGGTWNVHADGREPSTVAAAVDELVTGYRLDYLLLQEANGGVRAAIRRLGYTVVGEDDSPGAGANCVVSVEPAADPRLHRLSTTGWPLTPRKWHPPVWSWSARVRGTRVASVHLPNFERSPFHTLAYAQAARRIVGRVNRRHRLAERR